MTVPSFRSFNSTVAPFIPQGISPNMKALFDATSGAPVGFQSPNSTGPNGIFAPVQLTAEQIASPTTDMISDLFAVYMLNVAPYTRYRSDGTTLVEILSSSPVSFSGFIFAAAYSSINAALAAIPAEGGMTLILAPNTVYTINAPADRIISTKPNVTIWAPGWNTIIQRGSGLVASFDLVTLSGAGSKIVGVTVDGDAVVHTGFELVLSGAEGLAERCQVIDSAGSGHVKLAEDGCRITSSTITGLGTELDTERGYGVWALLQKRVTIDHNFVSGTNIDGIGFNGNSLCEGNDVRGCHLYTGNEGGQIAYYELEAAPTHAHGARIIGNAIGQGGTNGSGIEIDGNDVEDCYITGILQFWGSGAIVTNNRIRNCCRTANYDGITFWIDTTGFTCNGNSVIDDQTVATIRYPISVVAGESDDYEIVGNNLTRRGTGFPIVINDQGGGSGDVHKVIKANRGVDDVIPSLASAGTIVVPLNPAIDLTGSVTVTRIEIGLIAQGSQRTFLTDGAVVFTAGPTIGNDHTATAGGVTLATYNANGPFWYLK